MINRILFASDLGLYGPYLMRLVADLAQSTGASVDILHVIEPMGVFAESVIDSYMPEKEKEYLRNKGLAEIISKIRLQVIDTLKSEYSGYLDMINLADVLVEVGEPANLILEHANLRKSDMIVLAVHGQQGFGANVVGSIVIKVIKDSIVPVYILPMVSLSELDRS